jgi:hypothetical protein
MVTVDTISTKDFIEKHHNSECHHVEECCDLMLVYNTKMNIGKFSDMSHYEYPIQHALYFYIAWVVYLLLTIVEQVKFYCALTSCILLFCVLICFYRWLKAYNMYVPIMRSKLEYLSLTHSPTSQVIESKKAIDEFNLNVHNHRNYLVVSMGIFLVCSIGNGFVMTFTYSYLWIEAVENFLLAWLLQVHAVAIIHIIHLMGLIVLVCMLLALLGTALIFFYFNTFGAFVSIHCMYGKLMYEDLPHDIRNAPLTDKCMVCRGNYYPQEEIVILECHLKRTAHIECLPNFTYGIPCCQICRERPGIIMNSNTNFWTQRIFLMLSYVLGAIVTVIVLKVTDCVYKLVLFLVT